MRVVLGGIAVAVLLLVLGVCLPASRLETDLVQAPVDRPSPEADAGARGPQAPPNILFVLTDDQDAASVAEMPNVRSLLVAEGTSFDRAYATTAMCCPSRASILRGQYAHNHRILENQFPNGGFKRFLRLGREESTVATWLDGAGYHTGYMGKYLNEYGTFDEPSPHVPPGWDDWVGYEGGFAEEEKHGAFKVNLDGDVVRRNADKRHETDFLARQAENFIEDRGTDQPWFLAVATNAPHSPALASERNDGTYAGEVMPKGPAFNEADISDKASPWRDNARLSKECPKGYRERPEAQCLREATEHWRDRMESLQDVDDMVEVLVGALREKGFLRNTYIVFSSDNGYAMYDNRIYSKGAPYEGSHNVPMIVRGPGVEAGRTDNHLVANIDLAPTFAAWARADTPAFVDGRDMTPLLEDATLSWRTRLLFEHYLGDHDYNAIRTAGDRVLIEYPRAKDTEYYDLTEDPHQLEAGNTRPPDLEAHLRRLENCAGAECREADGGP
ncbi:MAG: sulfatase [Actinomycetota bacterium]|nr:sulfatase [Actinomycetota bacterium]